MRRHVVIFVVVLAAALPAAASTDDALEQLKTRAESARMEDRPGLYTDIARRQVEAADKLYAAGKVDEGRAAVENAVAYSDKAHEAAVHTGKKLKQTEIGERKMAARLRDIKRTLAFEDQAPLQTAIDHMEELRTDLLSRMFGKKESQ